MAFCFRNTQLGLEKSKSLDPMPGLLLFPYRSYLSNVRQRADTPLRFLYAHQSMDKIVEKPRKLSEVIDHIERIREELLIVQRSMENLQPEPDEPTSAK
jgi:hypothetical protein